MAGQGDDWAVRHRWIVFSADSTPCCLLLKMDSSLTPPPLPPSLHLGPWLCCHSFLPSSISGSGLMLFSPLSRFPPSYNYEKADDIMNRKPRHKKKDRLVNGATAPVTPTCTSVLEEGCPETHLPLWGGVGCGGSSE